MDTSFRQKHRSVFIPLLTCLCVMLSSVKFYTEPVVMTIKIEDVGPDRVLTSEFESQQLTAAENVPEKLFCVRLILTQLPGEIEKFRVQRGFHDALTLALSQREREYVPGEVKNGPFHLPSNLASLPARTRRLHVRRRDSVC
jgi:hypothetical protein